MSKQSQKKFLTEFHKRLLKESKPYRQKHADKQVHHFSIAKKNIREGIKDTVQSKFKTDSSGRAKEILSLVDSDIDRAIENVKNELRRLQDGATVANVRITYEKPDAIGALFYATKTDSGRLRNIYRQAFRAAKKHLDPLAAAVNKASVKVTGRGTGKTSKDYFHLSHGAQAGVAESQIRDEIIDVITEIPAINFSQAKEIIEAVVPNIELIRNTKTSSMSVHIGSKLRNLDEGRAVRDEKKDLARIIQDVEKMLRNPEIQARLLNAPGSDSLVDIKKKKVRKSVTDPLKKVKNVSVKSKNNKIKHSITKVKTKAKRPKISNTTPKSRVKKTKVVQRGMDFSPLRLIGLMNKQLPKTVRGNMVNPALENRTGRFANSVRFTDVAQTPQGYPSIGYTYARSPYEVFEMGSGNTRATPERDPRKLIDQSIREIAAQFAIGRFYTRRV